MINLGVKTKLILLITLPIVVTLLIAGGAMDGFFRSFHTQLATKATAETFDRLYYELHRAEETLSREGVQFGSREEIAASVSLISNYRDKLNYDAAVFDTEKKLLAAKLEEMGHLSLNRSDFSALYTKEGDLIAFAGAEESGVYYQCFLSYAPGGRPLLFTRTRSEAAWQEAADGGRFEIGLSGVAAGENLIPDAGRIDWLAGSDRFRIRYLHAITRKFPGAKSATVGYVELIREFDRSFMQQLAERVETDIAFSTDGLDFIGTFRGSVPHRELTDATPLVEGMRHDFKMIETGAYFVHTRAQPAEKGPIYFVSGYSKERLLFEINETRRFLLLILFVSALVVVPLSLFFMRRLIFDPLKKLLLAVESAKAGEYRPVELLKNKDEMAKLLEAFNEMAHTIKNRERELKTSEQSLNEAQQIARMGSWRIEFPGEKTVWSDEMYRIYDLKPGSIAVRKESFFEFIHPDDLGLVERIVERVTKEAREADFEYRIVSAAGNVKTLNSKARPVFDAEGNLTAFVGISHDITEIKEAQRELEAYKNELEKRVSEEITKRMEQEQILIQQSKLAAMGEMIGNIAHQWRQPLNTLGLKIQDIADAYEFGELDDVYLKQSVEESMRVIGRMSETINDFKDFFKPDKKKIDFTANEALDATLPIIAASLKNNFIDIEVTVRTDPVIHGFLNEYSQVLLNIINNAKDALKRCPSGKKVIQIVVDKDASERSVVTISDNGGGIPEEIIGRIYEPYFTTKHKAEGTGIGLYMSKMIIERNMRGSIRAENIEGGARFTITV
jgi:signal transduction histidine kinase